MQLNCLCTEKFSAWRIYKIGPNDQILEHFFDRAENVSATPVHFFLLNHLVQTMNKCKSNNCLYF